MCSRSSAAQRCDLQPVLNTLSETAARLCDAEHVWLFRRVGETYQWAASYGHSRENHERIKIHMLTRRLSPGRRSVIRRALLEGRPMQIADVLADPEYEETKSQKLAQFRTTFAAPLLRQGGEPIGAIALQRTVVKPFTEKQIELVQIFADQAVIAIENMRLFNEVQVRTDDFRKRLQQQTATADVLKVISRSTFDLQTGTRYAGGVGSQAVPSSTWSYILLREGEAYRLASGLALLPNTSEFAETQAILPGRGTVVARTALEGRTVHIPDILADPEYTFRDAQKRSAAIGPCSASRCCGRDTDRCDRSDAPDRTAVHRQADRAGRRPSPTRR